MLLASEEGHNPKGKHTHRHQSTASCHPGPQSRSSACHQQANPATTATTTAKPTTTRTILWEIPVIPPKPDRLWPLLRHL